jgi:hypothetical protein
MDALTVAVAAEKIATFLAGYVAHHGLDKTLEAGAAVLEQGQLRRIAGHIERVIGGNPAAPLVKRRNALSSRLMQHYIHDGKKIIGTERLRIAYVRCFEFFPGLGNQVVPQNVVATAFDPYDVDSLLGISGYKKAAVDYRVKLKHKEPFPGHAVRVATLDNETQFKLSPADYVDQFVTSQAEIVDTVVDEIVKARNLDIPGSYVGHTLRTIDTIDAALPPFSQSKVANTIGVAGMLLTSDGYLVLPRRNKTVHFAPGYEGCSVSGVLEWSSGLFADMVGEMEHQLLGKEGPHELLLAKGDCEAAPLAFARELERAGKPQFFFLIFANRTLGSFVEAWKVSPYVKEEYESVRWLKVFDAASLKADPQGEVDSLARTLLSVAAMDTSISFPEGGALALSEEARANLYYSALYLVARGPGAFPNRWTLH